MNEPIIVDEGNHYTMTGHVDDGERSPRRVDDERLNGIGDAASAAAAVKESCQRLPARPTPEPTEEGKVLSPKFKMMLRAAETMWLKADQLVDLLTVPGTPLEIAVDQPSTDRKPPSGSLILYDRTRTPTFRTDGYEWLLKKGAGCVREDYVMLRVGGKYRIRGSYAKGCGMDAFMQRRTYAVLDDAGNRQDSFVLAHYLYVNKNKNKGAAGEKTTEIVPSTTAPEVKPKRGRKKKQSIVLPPTNLSKVPAVVPPGVPPVVANVAQDGTGVSQSPSPLLQPQSPPFRSTVQHQDSPSSGFADFNRSKPQEVERMSHLQGIQQTQFESGDEDQELKNIRDLGGKSISSKWREAVNVSPSEFSPTNNLEEQQQEKGEGTAETPFDLTSTKASSRTGREQQDPRSEPLNHATNATTPPRMKNTARATPSPTVDVQRGNECPRDVLLDKSQQTKHMDGCEEEGLKEDFDELLGWFRKDSTSSDSDSDGSPHPVAPAPAPTYRPGDSVDDKDGDSSPTPKLKPHSSSEYFGGPLDFNAVSDDWHKSGGQPEQEPDFESHLGILEPTPQAFIPQGYNSCLPPRDPPAAAGRTTPVVDMVPYKDVAGRNVYKEADMSALVSPNSSHCRSPPPSPESAQLSPFQSSVSTQQGHGGGTSTAFKRRRSQEGVAAPRPLQYVGDQIQPQPCQYLQQQGGPQVASINNEDWIKKRRLASTTGFVDGRLEEFVRWAWDMDERTQWMLEYTVPLALPLGTFLMGSTRKGIIIDLLLLAYHLLGSALTTFGTDLTSKYHSKYAFITPMMHHLFVDIAIQIVHGIAVFYYRDDFGPYPWLLTWVMALPFPFYMVASYKAEVQRQRRVGVKTELSIGKKL